MTPKQGFEICTVCRREERIPLIPLGLSFPELFPMYVAANPVNNCRQSSAFGFEGLSTDKNNRSVLVTS
jgi:hypothetical protein